MRLRPRVSKHGRMDQEPWDFSFEAAVKKKKKRFTATGEALAYYESKVGMEWYKRRLAIAKEEATNASPVKMPIYPGPLPKGLFAPVSAEGVKKLAVPVPNEKVIPDDVSYQSRPGQREFRAAIIAAYGKCAVSGTALADALEAAHIIPYVDARSHIISNGLCLRADLHRLYDRSLMRIGADLVIHLAPELLKTGYAKLQGRTIRKPADEKLWPDTALLAIRHRFIAYPRPTRS